VLPLYSEVYPTALSFWVGVLVALIHYTVRRRVVELFGTGFGTIVVSSAVHWWTSGIIGALMLYLGYVGIAYIIISAIILMLKAVQYSADVLSRTVIYAYTAQEHQGQRLSECKCICQ
jgi:hypothetical protein